MGDKSKIEWTDATWNPIRARLKEKIGSKPAKGTLGWHCEHVSPGCEHCYAEGMNKRLGTGLPFKPGHRANVEIFLDENMLRLPLQWKKPRMIFVCSMTDLFAEFIKEEWLDRIFAVMALCPKHTFQVLTKRPARMRKYFAELMKTQALGLNQFGIAALATGLHGPAGTIRSWPLSNVWLGVSAEDQQRADERIPLLLETPAAVRFVSLEPLLGPIHLHPLGDGTNALSSSTGPNLDWVIVGGESGPNARPMDIDWVRWIRTECRLAEVPYFVKQLGSKPMLHGFTGMPIKNRKGGNPAEWPEDLRVREMPVCR